MKDTKKMSAFERKIGELEAAESIVDFCLERAEWWRDKDENGNITFQDGRHQALHEAYLNLAEKLTKEYTK